MEVDTKPEIIKQKIQTRRVKTNEVIDGECVVSICSVTKDALGAFRTMLCFARENSRSHLEDRMPGHEVARIQKEVSNLSMTCLGAPMIPGRVLTIPLVRLLTTTENRCPLGVA